jgi:PAS domain-containing protein
MVDKLSEQVRACRERALDAKRGAKETAHPALKADFLELEKCWSGLARSYLFTEKIADFIAAIPDRRRGLDERSRVNERRDHTLRLQEIRTLRQLNGIAREAADLIEHQDMSLESRQRLRRLASIVESSDHAVISKNLDGIITTWNEGAERLFGYSAEEVIGQPITIRRGHWPTHYHPNSIRPPTRGVDNS